MLGSEDDSGSAGAQDVDYVLWGVGNHGGGPSRKDLRDIENLKRDGVTFVHSSPDRLMNDDIRVQGEMRTSLVTCMPGCYSSMARVKRAHRETESLYFSTEKMLAYASLCGGGRRKRSRVILFGKKDFVGLQIGRVFVSRDE